MKTSPTCRRLSTVRLRRLIAPVVERYHPERVILFGSHAYGRPTTDSDVDLLVIMRPAVNPASIRCALSDDVAIDVLVRTPGQIRRRVEMGDPFVREILERGRVLHDARRQRVG